MLSEREIEKIAGLSVFHHDCLMALRHQVIPGMNGLKLRSFLERYIKSRSKSVKVASFDVNINISVCHKAPDSTIFMNEDIMTLDLVLQDAGLYADGAWTFICGESSPANRSLVQNAWNVSVNAFKTIRENGSSLQMKKSIHNTLTGSPYSLIEDACGHGIGKSIHEKPDINYSLTNQNDIFWKKGMVFTLEPVIALNGAKLFQDKEKGYITDNHTLCAYFEHMVAIDHSGVHCLNIPQINDLDSIDIFSEII